jgi:hypothetical protein
MKIIKTAINTLSAIFLCFFLLSASFAKDRALQWALDYEADGKSWRLKLNTAGVYRINTSRKSVLLSVRGVASKALRISVHQLPEPLTSISEMFSGDLAGETVFFSNGCSDELTDYGIQQICLVVVKQ